MGRTAAWVAALVLVAAMNGGAWAQASPPAPAPGPFDDPCFEVVTTNLSACLDFVDPTNKTTPASNSDCCKGMGDFLRLSPQCICYLLNTNLTDVLELDIDRGKALNLPNVCKKKLPLSELSKCSGNASSGAANSKCLEPVAEKLIPCLDYVDPASNKTKPPSNGGCCSGLKTFLKEDSGCLCSLINAKPGDFPISIDRTKVLQLPGFCNATIPSFRCSGNTTLSAPENKCLTPVVSKLASCIEYVDPASNKTKPAAKGGCCSGLKTFLKEDSGCLCSLVNAKPGDFPISIDRTKVLQLPGFCNATIPSFRCSGNTTLSAPENKCLTPVVSKLASCIEYVDPASNKTKPAAKGGCCSGLKTFLKEDSGCLCSLVNAKPGDFPISIDRTKVLQLPGFCNATIPSFRCSGNTTLSAPENKCLTPVVSKLASCIEYVDPTSNKTKPAAKGGCCSGLKTFLKEDFHCLCSLVNAKPGDFPISIDRTKVLQLPGFCNATIPSFRCSGNTTLSAPENKCLTPVVSKLASCIEYVDPTSNKTKPAAQGGCCSGLKTFLKEDFHCLCSLVNAKPGDFPISIDRTKVLQLPGFCNATIPSFRCSGNVTSIAPANACLMPVLENLATCVDYVDPAVNKSEGPVSGDCCNGLRNFVENQPRCICPIVDGKTDEYPISIDRGKAIGLVSSCKVPLVSSCFASDSPAGTPPGAPAGGAQPGFTPSATALLAGATLVIAAAFF